jgi:hypothetical protein
MLYSFLISPMRAKCHPSHSPWLEYPNNIWWIVQVMKLLIMQSSPASCHFLPLRSKYSPQRHFVKHPKSSFCLVIEIFYHWFKGRHSAQMFQRMNFLQLHWCHFTSVRYNVPSRLM